MRQRHTVLVLALIGGAAGAAPPGLDEYARGVVIESYGATPLLELALPDPVYQHVTRTDLRDLRVFNADGAPVPHAFCAAPEAAAPAIAEDSLPVFELKQATRAEQGARIEVETGGGTRMNVQEDGGAAQRASSTHIIDARSVEDALRAIQFDWSSPDGASEAQVRIEASADLDVWRTIVPASTLLRAAAGEQTLRRERIELPLQPYEYLRVQRADGGPPLVLNRVVAERVEAARELEPLWFMPNAQTSAEPNVLQFDTARLAPVRFARVRLSVDNSSLRVTLQSRPDETSPWRERWSGETYIVASATERRESPPARFEPTTDRYWRVLLPKDAPAALVPTLEFGYRPLQVRFLTQGPGPYTLAFGSRRAELAAPAGCDGLLADVSAEERRTMVSEAYAGELKNLGGDAALKAPAKRTPTRVMVLWGVLIVGVGLLVAMALSLLKRVRT